MTPSEQIEKRLAELSDWRGQRYAELRGIITEADPGLILEWKWGTAVWSKNGLVCALSAFKDKVKINFFKGASMEDSKKLFNAGLDAKTMRSIDFYEKDPVDKEALTELVREAAQLNQK